MYWTLVILCLAIWSGISGFGNTAVNGLHYSGAATFDQGTGELKFVSSGTIQDPVLKKTYSKSETVDGYKDAGSMEYS